MESEGLELFIILNFGDFFGDDVLQTGGEDELLFQYLPHIFLII